MNLAFSTRGWRDADWKKQVEDACEMQFRGIEVYNLHRIPSLTDRGAPFHKYNRNETDRMLQEYGLISSVPKAGTKSYITWSNYSFPGFADDPVSVPVSEGLTDEELVVYTMVMEFAQKDLYWN